MLQTAAIAKMLCWMLPKKAEVDALKQRAESHASQLKAQEDRQAQAEREATARCGYNSHSTSDLDLDISIWRLKGPCWF